MPGIYGIVNHTGKVIAPSDIGRSLKHFPFYSDTVFRCGSFAGGVVSRNTPVWIAEKGKMLFILYGEIYSLDEAGFTGNVDDLFAEYLRSGYGLFKKVNGEFCAVVWNENDRTLTIVTDHLGTKPVYYYTDEDHIVIAPEVKAINQASPRSARMPSASFSRSDFAWMIARLWKTSNWPCRGM
jgi:asparagine synthetase B (glutamine-hydrolysing)